MNHDELESQLSAMYDGELPAAECELLSRRIDRDETLRARWSRYALIGAVMRSEPVATARSGFAARVSAALSGPSPAAAAARTRRGRELLWSGALAAMLVASVAGVSISMLRDAALRDGGPAVAATSAPQGAPQASPEGRPGANEPANEPAHEAVNALDSEPASYVTPAVRGGAHTLLRTELADYIVAHSAYSAPLMRRHLLSELVTSEDVLDGAPGGPAEALPARGALVGGIDGTRDASDTRH